MRKTKIFKEIIIGGIVIAPLVYFFNIWNNLPTKIPIHFDAHGNPDNYGNRSYIALTLFFLSLGTYLFMLYIPKIDPKKNFSIFSTTYIKLRFIISLFFSLICFAVIHSVKNGELNTIYFYFTFAIMISLFGNYMSNIRPNYFIGIRTPWALESESNWKATHYISGRLWFITGIIMGILLFVLPVKYAVVTLMCSIVIIAIFPLAYSFFKYRTAVNSRKITNNEK